MAIKRVRKAKKGSFVSIGTNNKSEKKIGMVSDRVFGVAVSEKGASWFVLVSFFYWYVLVLTLFRKIIGR
jgi:hypothetical protein